MFGWYNPHPPKPARHQTTGFCMRSWPVPPQNSNCSLCGWPCAVSPKLSSSADARCDCGCLSATPNLPSRVVPRWPCSHSARYPRSAVFLAVPTFVKRLWPRECPSLAAHSVYWRHVQQDASSARQDKNDICLVYWIPLRCSGGSGPHP